jgi:hypothetical protein
MDKKYIIVYAHLNKEWTSYGLTVIFEHAKFTPAV